MAYIAHLVTGVFSGEVGIYDARVCAICSMSDIVFNQNACAITNHSQSAKDVYPHFKSQLYVENPGHWKPLWEMLRYCTPKVLCNNLTEQRVEVVAISPKEVLIRGRVVKTEDTRDSSLICHVCHEVWWNWITSDAPSTAVSGWRTFDARVWTPSHSQRMFSRTASIYSTRRWR